MNLEKFYNDLKDNIKKILVNLAFIFPFWALAIFITKPSFIENPIHIQFILTFCLSFVWLFIYFIIAVLIITIFKKDNIFIALEIGNFLGIFSLCIFINIAYYLSQSITTLIKISFNFSLVFLLLFGILSFVNYLRKQKKRVIEITINSIAIYEKKKKIKIPFF